MKIKVGQKLTNSELFYLDQNNNVKKVDILDLCKDNKTIILGMPGAFTKTCSALHLPGYIKNFELASKKGISNTKLKGGNTKQLVYFRGALKVRDLIEKDPDIIKIL